MPAPEGNQNAVGNNGGAPSLCTPEMCMKARDYLVRYKESGDEVIPTIEGLALWLGVARKTIHNWVNNTENVEFLLIYDTLMQKQGSTLVNKGLNGVFNSTISKLILSKHDYIEKTENTNNVKLQDPDSKEKAKLDAILNGTPSPKPTEQGSDGSGNQRNEPAEKVLSK